MNLACPHGLSKRIPKCCRLGRSCHHATSSPVCHHLVQQQVLRTTSHDVNGVDALLSHTFEKLENLPVAFRQALKNNASHAAHVPRYLLPGRCTEVTDAFRVIAGRNELIEVQDCVDRFRL